MDEKPQKKKFCYVVLSHASGRPMAVRYDFKVAIKFLKDYVDSNPSFSDERFTEHADFFEATALYAPPPSTMLEPVRCGWSVVKMEIL